METIANRIVDYLDTDKTTWNEVDRMRMSLGLQVIIHNIVMIGTILLVSKLQEFFGSRCPFNSIWSVKNDCRRSTF